MSMNKHSGYDIEKIKNKISKYEYISFDIFDTLIKRNVKKPSDIFKLTSIEYEKKYNKKIENYKEIRIKAEVDARSKDKNGEPNIDDIFENINIGDDSNIANELKQIEIDLEMRLCQKNINFYPIYKYCIENKKKIIITSDMYLNKKYIKEILNKAEINKYDYLFISNDVKLNKHTGRIYPYILEKLSIRKNQIIHIGDSKRGDWINSRINGINSILIPKEINNLNYYNENGLEESKKNDYIFLQAFINNNLPMNKNQYFKIGYETLGTLLYGYSKWILDSCKKNNVKEIFFLAREGHLLKQSFDLINDTDIKSKYLYVSRRSVRPALLKDVESIEELAKIIKIKENTTFEKFLLDIGLEPKKYANILKEYNCDLKNKVKEVSKLKEIFNNLKWSMKQNALNEEKNVIGYLKQNNFFSDNVVIADVGWAGTMQKCLSQIHANGKIKGYYVASTEENPMLEKYAFFESYDEIRPFVHLFENMFLAQHGTTLKYQYKNNEYEPILDEYEYSNNEKQIFIDIQNGAIQFIKDFKYNKMDNFIFEEKALKNSIIRLGLFPNIKDVKSFKNTSYMETKKMNLIETKNLLYYVVNLKQMKEDFYSSGWKIGFLKQVFRINLPYYKIYKAMLKNKK